MEPLCTCEAYPFPHRQGSCDKYHAELAYETRNEMTLTEEREEAHESKERERGYDT